MQNTVQKWGRHWEEQNVNCLGVCGGVAGGTVGGQLGSSWRAARGPPKGRFRGTILSSFQGMRFRTLYGAICSFPGGGGSVGGRGGVGPTRLTIKSSTPPSTSRGDQGAKALRNPFVLSHAEIPTTSNAIWGFLRSSLGRQKGAQLWHPLA